MRGARYSFYVQRAKHSASDIEDAQPDRCAKLRRMAKRLAPLTEKNFYLAEFRGRSLGIALPGGDSFSPAEWAAFDALLAELAGNDTRVVLLSPDGALLENACGAPPMLRSDAGWVGPLWRLLSAAKRIGLQLPGDAFAAECRAAALRLGLAKLVWIDGRGGFVRSDGTRLSVVDLDDLHELLEATDGSGEGLTSQDQALLREVHAMVSGGIPAVNLCSLSGLGDELFTYAGSGTFFTRMRYADVRRLALDDFDAASELIARGVDEGYLAPRTLEEIDHVLSHAYGLFVEGRFLAGIASLLPVDGGRVGEIASLYTLTRFLGEGVGGSLITHVMDSGKRDGFSYLFACTTSERVERFFERHGFQRVSPDELPAEKWKGYSSERRESIRCLRCDVD
jgi:N-acetylglutamate synthase-like GNAT family acetyltransferase